MGAGPLAQRPAGREPTATARVAPLRACRGRAGWAWSRLRHAHGAQASPWRARGGGWPCSGLPTCGEVGSGPDDCRRGDRSPDDCGWDPRRPQPMSGCPSMPYPPSTARKGGGGSGAWVGWLLGRAAASPCSSGRRVPTGAVAGGRPTGERASTPRGRLGHVHAPAEVAGAELIVAVSAKGCELVGTPPLCGDPVCCLAVVAEVAGAEAAVNAWPEEGV